MSETGANLDVTRETLDSLAAKLNSFHQGLPEEERVVLATVIVAGAQALSSEVQGFGLGDLHIDWSSLHADLDEPLRPVLIRKSSVARSLDMGSQKAGETPS